MGLLARQVSRHNAFFFCTRYAQCILFLYTLSVPHEGCICMTISVLQSTGGQTRSRFLVLTPSGALPPRRPAHARRFPTRLPAPRPSAALVHGLRPPHCGPPSCSQRPSPPSDGGSQPNVFSVGSVFFFAVESFFPTMVSPHEQMLPQPL